MRYAGAVIGGVLGLYAELRRPLVDARVPLPWMKSDLQL